MGEMSYNAKYYQEHKTQFREYDKAYRDDERNWAKLKLKGMKYRARKRGLEFNLTEEDLKVPAVCPVLGIPLKIKGTREECPSVDRFDNTKGYTKDNVRIISYRANMIKCDATLQELERLVTYMKGTSNGQA